MITREELAEIKRRADAATEGPWRTNFELDDGTLEFDGYRVSFRYIYSRDKRRAIVPHMLIVESKYGGTSKLKLGYDTDIEFITKAIEDIPKLVAEVERLRDMVDKLHEQLRKADDYIDRVDFELAITKAREAMDRVAERIRERAKNE